ncbi:hypothetical protein AAMO2058_001756100 [Amorphochlora amoebiformis]
MGEILHVFANIQTYREFMRDNWFGESEAYNLPELKTLTQGKTTRLVKDDSTGNILLGYSESDVVSLDGIDISTDVLISQDQKSNEFPLKIEGVAKGSQAENVLKPGDIITGVIKSDGSSVSPASITPDELRSGGYSKIQVGRELFKPAWLEPKVWGDDGERLRTYFTEQKFNAVRKAKDKNFKSSPGLSMKDVTVFERGKGDEGFGMFKSFFSQTELKGEGSFGQVFDGELKNAEGKKKIVLKRSKDKVIGALEMLQLELILNKEITQRMEPGYISPFVGFIEVPEDVEGQIYDGFLSTGLWLLWETLDGRTLDRYLDQGTLSKELLQMMGKTSEETFIKTFGTMCICAHIIWFVHRDVKAENLLLVSDGSVKLIDLGATASCKGKPISYEVGVGPQDPAYTAIADRVLLPEGSPKPTYSNLDSLWDTYRPDKFDVFSGASVILQTACPNLRSREALITFQENLHKNEYDLESVRRQMNLKSQPLDANGGAGWDFLSACVQKDRLKRPSSEEALQHPFLA